MKSSKIKVAVCQLLVKRDWQENISKAISMIEKAAREGSDMVILPEMFICHYSAKAFAVSAQIEGEDAWKMMSDAARNNKVYIVAGSMPELRGDGFYNTTWMFDRDGKQIGKYSKMHLFDVNVSGKVSFGESEILKPGDKITIVPTEFGDIGLAICYDLRFPELFRLMGLNGAKLIVIPSGFSRATGEAHWEVLLRARAIENQCYMLGCEVALDESSSYQAWGHSMVVSPWGDILGELGTEEGMLMTELDMDMVDSVRREMPVYRQRRTDKYMLNEI